MTETVFPKVYPIQPASKPIGHKAMAACLSKLASAFLLDQFHCKHGSSIAEAWYEALVDIEEDEFEKACFRLVRKLKRFPVPADVIEEVREMRGTEVQP